MRTSKRKKDLKKTKTHKSTKAKTQKTTKATQVSKDTRQPIAQINHTTTPKKTKQPTWLSIYLVLITIAIILIWFSQASINAYWQQTYHRTSPLEQLNHPLWQKGEQWQKTAYEYPQHYQNWINQLNTKWQNHWQPEKQPTLSEATTTAIPTQNTNNHHSQAHTTLATTNTPEPTNPSEPTPNPATPTTHNQAILQENDIVFFAGDSLMQGVAPHVQRWLKQQHNIDSINLSKQSTGLSYPSFFDWPATIETTIANNPQISLLIIFLGPNDPWDFPNPEQKTAPYLKFQSPQWQATYQQRIQRILQAAQQANITVIWLGIPHMKSNKLNQQMHYLNQIIAESLTPQTIWLPTDQLLSGEQQTYVDSITINGVNTRLRSKDGIHFTIKGQKYLAEYIQQHIQYQTPNNPNQPTTEQNN